MTPFIWVIATGINAVISVHTGSPITIGITAFCAMMAMITAVVTR